MHISQIINTSPNLSIVAPGGCNASCDFCFWTVGKTDPDYIKNLKTVLSKLPDDFQQLSITGGEPTISPYLVQILNSINREKFKKVVLTTNGFRLRDYIKNLKGIVDYINISRHCIEDVQNESIFKTSGLPTTKDLKSLIKHIHKVGIDVTLNCVTGDTFKSLRNFENFVTYARKLGADSVCFRKPHGTLDYTEFEVEAIEKYGLTGDSRCPVCRSHITFIDQYPVLWKGSVSEPSEVLGSIFELIYNPDGLLTADWQKKILVNLEEIL